MEEKKCSAKQPEMIDSNDQELIGKELEPHELDDVAGGTRRYRRCRICGRPHGFVGNTDLCRNCYRELMKNGELEPDEADQADQL